MYTRQSSWLISGLIVSLSIASITAQSQTRRKVYVPGQRAIVIDERLSVLRTQPDIKAPMLQRLRRGRAIGILASRKAKDGEMFWRVAVSRNVRGWVLAESAVKAGSVVDAERLLKLIEDSDDEFIKARLAKLCADEFRLTIVAPRCLLKLGETAERVAERLTRDAKRRIGDQEPSAGLNKRAYFLNFVGLDRYNRIGVMFDYDATTDRIVYDEEAYLSLQRRYPKSAEALVLKDKLSRK